jgi:hypothetical protein
MYRTSAAAFDVILVVLDRAREHHSQRDSRPLDRGRRRVAPLELLEPVPDGARR